LPAYGFSARSSVAGDEQLTSFQVLEKTFLNIAYERGVVAKPLDRALDHLTCIQASAKRIEGI
jgi:hypothetical protein